MTAVLAQLHILATATKDAFKCAGERNLYISTAAPSHAAYVKCSYCTVYKHYLHYFRRSRPMTMLSDALQYDLSRKKISIAKLLHVTAERHKTFHSLLSGFRFYFSL